MTESGVLYAIRQAKFSDVGKILEIEGASFPDPYDRPTFLSFLILEPEGFLVAEAGGTVIGYVIASINRGYGLIASIAVSADHKRRGIGSKLMRAALDYLAGRGIGHVELQVDVTNAAAVRLYERFSFRETGRIDGYYPNGRDALIMRRDFPDTESRTD